MRLRPGSSSSVPGPSPGNCVICVYNQMVACVWLCACCLRLVDCKSIMPGVLCCIHLMLLVLVVKLRW